MTVPTVEPALESDRELADAAERLGTPLFFYSLPALRAQIARLRSSFSSYPIQMLFATMANDRAEILRTIASERVGACVNSLLHMRRAMKEGFSADKIHFTSCGLPVEDMQYLQAMSIPANLDSPLQIETWCRLKTGAVAGARMNAASLNGSPAKSDRIGMSIPDFERSCDLARRLEGRVNGIHVYAGTNFQSANDMLRILRGAFEIVRDHPELDYINIGGGIGIDYQHSGREFEYAYFGREICAMAREVSEQRGNGLRVLFEPGRSLVGCSASFITRVTDIKDLDRSRFVVVDASVSVFPRPYHHPDTPHRARVLGAATSNGTRSIPSTVVGRTTFSRDILGNYNLPEDLTVGSLLSFDDAGAYCESMMSRFLGQREPSCFVYEQ
jgi:diaminopimelate decarboxylase